VLAQLPQPPAGRRRRGSAGGRWPTVPAPRPSIIPALARPSRRMAKLWSNRLPVLPQVTWTSCRWRQGHPVNHGGFGYGRTHCPVLAGIEFQVGVVVARRSHVPWPRLYCAVTTNQHHEVEELQLEIRPPRAHGVLMWPLGHRLGELPANIRDVGASIVDRELHDPRLKALADRATEVGKSGLSEARTNGRLTEQTRDAPSGRVGGVVLTNTALLLCVKASVSVLSPNTFVST